MTMPRLTRRRTLTIMAAACATPAVLATPAHSRQVWHGPVLGGDGKLIFDGISRDVAQQVTVRVVAEIDRLEQTFSLFRRDVGWRTYCSACRG